MFLDNLPSQQVKLDSMVVNSPRNIIILLINWFKLTAGVGGQDQDLGQGLQPVGRDEGRDCIKVDKTW